MQISANLIFFKPRQVSRERFSLSSVLQTDRVVYDEGQKATATVIFIDLEEVGNTFLSLGFGTENSGDIEIVEIQTSKANPLIYFTKSPVVIATNTGSPVQNDGTLELDPNEIFSALLSYKLSDRTQSSVRSQARGNSILRRRCGTRPGCERRASLSSPK